MMGRGELSVGGHAPDVQTGATAAVLSQVPLTVYFSEFGLHLVSQSEVDSGRQSAGRAEVTAYVQDMFLEVMLYRKMQEDSPFTL